MHAFSAPNRRLKHENQLQETLSAKDEGVFETLGQETPTRVRLVPHGA